MGNIFEQDFIDFITCLNDSEVEYILVGGYAVVIHGYNRTTGDLDVWVNPSASNFEKLMDAFLNFGLPTEVISKSQFLNMSNEDVFSFGRPPIAIDIMTAVKGLKFDDTYKLAEWCEFDDVKIKVIHRNDLIRAKKAAGRYKDLNDIEHLEGK